MGGILEIGRRAVSIHDRSAPTQNLCFNDIDRLRSSTRSLNVGFTPVVRRCEPWKSMSCRSFDERGWRPAIVIAGGGCCCSMQIVERQWASLVLRRQVISRHGPRANLRFAVFKPSRLALQWRRKLVEEVPVCCYHRSLSRGIRPAPFDTWVREPAAAARTGRQAPLRLLARPENVRSRGGSRGTRRHLMVKATRMTQLGH